MSQTSQKKKKGDLPKCANCKGDDKSLGKCERCRLVSYCSEACQKQHWKNDHKEMCFTPEQRRVSAQPKVGTTTNESDEDTCPVCFEPLQPISAASPAFVALPCSHEVHTACLGKLRRFGEQQSCPLCRSGLPPSSPEVPTAAAAACPLQVNDGCANCGAKAGPDNTTSLKPCGRCKTTMYCGRECQMAHWKEGGHRNACKPGHGHKMAHFCDLKIATFWVFTPGTSNVLLRS